jgi:hypothetical protein
MCEGEKKVLLLFVYHFILKKRDTVNTAHPVLILYFLNKVLDYDEIFFLEKKWAMKSILLSSFNHNGDSKLVIIHNHLGTQPGHHFGNPTGIQIFFEVFFMI